MQKHVCICSCVCYACVCRHHVDMFVFAPLWILLQYDTIILTVITIDFAVDGEASSIKLSAPRHGPLVL